MSAVQTLPQVNKSVNRIPFHEDGDHIDEIGMDNETGRAQREANRKAQPWISPASGRTFHAEPRLVNTAPLAPVKFTKTEIDAIIAPSVCPICEGEGIRLVNRRREKCYECGGVGQVDWSGLKQAMLTGLIRATDRLPAQKWFSMHNIVNCAPFTTASQRDIAICLFELMSMRIVAAGDGGAHIGVSLYRLTDNAKAARAAEVAA